MLKLKRHEITLMTAEVKAIRGILRYRGYKLNRRDQVQRESWGEIWVEGDEFKTRISVPDSNFAKQIASILETYGYAVTHTDYNPSTQQVAHVLTVTR